jgi:DNA-binding NarL/FixJ family response regulator
MQHGAYGYVFKSNISRDLVRAINAVSHGERFIPQSVQ